MPALHFWFTGTAIYLFISFAFAVAVGLIGIKDMIPRKLLYALLLAASVISGLAWRTAAKQESDSSAQETKSSQLEDTIRSLNKSITVISGSNLKQETQLSNVAKQNENLLLTLNQIASAAKVDPGLPAQALADQVVEKLSSLEGRLSIVENPPREPNQLYIGTKSVAYIEGISADRFTGIVVLATATSANPLDFSQDFYLQNAEIKCAKKDNAAFARTGAATQYTYLDVSCTMIGKVP